MDLLFQYPVGHSGVRTIGAISTGALYLGFNTLSGIRGFGRGRDLRYEPGLLVSIPCRAFGGSDGTGGLLDLVEKFGFNTLSGIRGFGRYVLGATSKGTHG